MTSIEVPNGDLLLILSQLTKKLELCLGMGIRRVQVTVGMPMATFYVCQNSHRSTRCECNPIKYSNVTSHGTGQREQLTVS